MVMLDDQQATDLECFKNKTHKMTVPIGITNKILIFFVGLLPRSPTKG